MKKTNTDFCMPNFPKKYAQNIFPCSTYFQFSIQILLFLTFFTAFSQSSFSQTKKQLLAYSLMMPKPENHTFHIELKVSGWAQDTLLFKMPKWMPGYYQLMDYAKSVENISAKDQHGNKLVIEQNNENSWKAIGTKNKAFTVSYDIKTQRQFVANSYLDSTHAYVVTANTFLYVDGFLNTPVTVKVITNQPKQIIATGLENIVGKFNEYSAPNFDILYDSPLLIGDLETLVPFKVKGINHRFIAYKMGTFNREAFTENLEKMVTSAVKIMGDIPYKEYTFIGIGPGRGGIEHLNNTTVSFDGNGLNNPASMMQVMNFLAHEYFHHYNVKRIRPFELGPFDYDKGSRTNLLWISEGLTVYYEYIVIKRAGLMDEKTLLSNLEHNINALENNNGRLYQSLSQASYNTWKDGPFGTQGEEAGKTISYYDKGPVVGLLLDFAIRNASQNEKSLDDVMRLLYWQYYKKLNRGFTDAEFQTACEQIAGASLSKIFEYVNTTKELDYRKYLAFAGLGIKEEIAIDGKRKLSITRLTNLTPLQTQILTSWLGE